MKSNQDRIKAIIKSLSTGWLPGERETSILFDHSTSKVFFETSDSYTARRLYNYLKNDPLVQFDEKADLLKFSIPENYCRKIDLILMAKYRKPDAS